MWARARYMAHSPLLKSGRRTATDLFEVQPGPRNPSRRYRNTHFTIPRRRTCLVRWASCEVAALRSARATWAWAGSTFVSQCVGQMYNREVRSGNSCRKARNKGGTTTRRPSLTLLDQLLMELRRGFPTTTHLAGLRYVPVRRGNGADIATRRFERGVPR